MIRNLMGGIWGRLRRGLLSDVYDRISTLEYRSFNRRFFAIEQCAEYLVGAQIEGDYMEFGVYRGDTFSHAYGWMSPHFKDMRFVAFDSFEGLPKPDGLDTAGGYSSHFFENQFACSEDAFIANIRSKGVDLGKVDVVRGWFDEALVSERAASIGKVAVAWIDCDLYESTVPVLKYLTRRLQVGTVVIFDDWRCYRNHPEFGEQRACHEWLQENPNIRLAELYSFGWNGIAFTVISC